MVSAILINNNIHTLDILQQADKILVIDLAVAVDVYGIFHYVRGSSLGVLQKSDKILVVDLAVAVDVAGSMTLDCDRAVNNSEINVFKLHVAYVVRVICQRDDCGAFLCVCVRLEGQIQNHHVIGEVVRIKPCHTFADN